ncbi:MAG: hypothetical protein E3J66_00845 [Dehalococcoidia bacterium]|nr:MAG: hypothetical protein E3J66_00845 [Dehalococcoidia bacterium]
MKKILMSLFTIAIVAALIGGGVVAVFTDTDSSNPNTFQAGTLDIVVTTSGACSDGGKVTVQSNSVAFANLAPGDSGSITWTVTNTGSLDGNILVEQSLTNDTGELDDEMILISTCTIDGDSTFPGAPWEGKMSDIGLYPIVDLLPQPLPAGSVLVLTYNWSIPIGVGNIIQGDAFAVGMLMTLSQ